MARRHLRTATSWTTGPVPGREGAPPLAGPPAAGEDGPRQARSRRTRRGTLARAAKRLARLPPPRPAPRRRPLDSPRPPPRRAPSAGRAPAGRHPAHGRRHGRRRRGRRAGRPRRAGGPAARRRGRGHASRPAPRGLARLDRWAARMARPRPTRPPRRRPRAAARGRGRAPPPPEGRHRLVGARPGPGPRPARPRPPLPRPRRPRGTVWRRAALGALGAAALLVGEAARRTTVYAADRAPRDWAASVPDALDDVLVPLVLGPGPALALAWSALAVALPVLVRGAASGPGGRRGGVDRPRRARPRRRRGFVGLDPSPEAVAGVLGGVVGAALLAVLVPRVAPLPPDGRPGERV